MGNAVLCSKDVCVCVSQAPSGTSRREGKNNVYTMDKELGNNDLNAFYTIMTNLFFPCLVHSQ